MNNKVLVGIVAVVVVLGGILWFVQSQNKASDEAMIESDAMMEKENTGDAMMEKEDTMMEQETTAGDTMMQGGYKDYDPAYLAFAEKGKVVLFFKASWCPTCKALDADITKNLSQIPSDVMILKVDYDNSSDLKKKYQVLSQHTLVQVDKDGNMKSKWQGGNTLSELLGEIK